jgi:hypothetical protein
MNQNQKPPKKKKLNPEGPENPKDTRHDTREQPAASERTEDGATTSIPDDRAVPDASATDRQPVTNEDEQERITNAGSGNRPIPEK